MNNKITNNIIKNKDDQNNFLNNNDDVSNNNFINNFINNNENYNNNNENNNEKTEGALHNRTLIVGPSFCGKTHLFLKKLQIIRLDNPEQKIPISTRSPEHYTGFEIEDVSVEEDLEDRTIQDFQNCCFVFDDMLDSNQKLIVPSLLEEDIMIQTFIIYHSHILIYLKEQLETIRIKQFYFNKP